MGSLLVEVSASPFGLGDIGGLKMNRRIGLSVYISSKSTDSDIQNLLWWKPNKLTNSGNIVDVFEESTFTPSTNASPTKPTRGGYAPTPPHPEYQSTVSLQQQLVCHSNSLHYHVDAAINRLTRTFEKANNWTTDQVMRQVDNMTDIAEQLVLKTSQQNEILTEMKQMVYELRSQVDAVRNENREMEARLREGIRDEIRKTRAESVIRRDSRLIPPSDSRCSGIGTRTTGTERNSHQQLAERLARGRNNASNMTAPYNTERRERGQLLRQVKSKPSLTSMSKRAEHLQIPMPMPMPTHMQPVSEDAHPPTFLTFPSSVDTVSASASNVSSSTTRSIENDRPPPLDVKKRPRNRTQKSSRSLNGGQATLDHDPRKPPEYSAGEDLFLPESFIASVDDVRESGLGLSLVQGEEHSGHIAQSGKNIPISSYKQLSNRVLSQNPTSPYDPSGLYPRMGQMGPATLDQLPATHLANNLRPPVPIPSVSNFSYESPRKINKGVPDEDSQKTPRKPNNQKTTNQSVDGTNKTPKKRVMRMGIRERHGEGHDNNQLTGDHGLKENQKTPRKRPSMGMFSFGRRREVETRNMTRQYMTESNTTESDAGKQHSTTDKFQSALQKQSESNKQPSATYVLYPCPPTLPPPSYPPPPTPNEHHDNG